MEPSWAENENIGSDLKKAIEEKLIQGRQFASQLLVMLRDCFQDEGAEDLAAKVLGTFAHSLSILNSTLSDEVSQVPAISPTLDGRKSEDSSESSKTTPALRDRRGCYKRRKTSRSWTRITPALIDDGHAWRKYGQKVILNATHPRNYFRCTHKFDQGCQATKQVQKTEDPTMYRTTYHGHHTCKSSLKGPQLILDSYGAGLGESSILLSFQSNSNPSKNQNHSHPFSRSLYPSNSIKQHFKEEQEFEAPINLNHDQSSMSDYLLSPYLTTFNSLGTGTGPIGVLSSGSGSDDYNHGDVISSGMYSRTANTRSNFHMDHTMVGCVDDFDDVLQYEF